MRSMRSCRRRARSCGFSTISPRISRPIRRPRFTSSAMAAISIAPGVLVDDNDITERFVRASGPGGQNVNKVATAVELRFDLNRSQLPQEVKDRVRTLAGRRLHADGALVIDSRVFRSQERNR